MKLPCGAYAGVVAFLPYQFILLGAFREYVKFLLEGAFDVFTEFSALILNKSFRYHSLSVAISCFKLISVPNSMAQIKLQASAPKNSPFY